MSIFWGTGSIYHYIKIYRPPECRFQKYSEIIKGINWPKCGVYELLDNFQVNQGHRKARQPNLIEFNINNMFVSENGPQNVGPAGFIRFQRKHSHAEINGNIGKKLMIIQFCAKLWS